MNQLVKLYFSITFWIILLNLGDRFLLWNTVTIYLVIPLKLMMFLCCFLFVHRLLESIKKSTDKKLFLFISVTSLCLFAIIFSKIAVSTALSALILVLIFIYIVIPFSFISTNIIFNYVKRTE